MSEETAVATRSESHGLLTVIERLSANPNVDVSKIEKFLDMQERILSRNAESAYTAALAQMQAELPRIKERGGIRDRSGNVQSTYALWEDVNAAILPVLQRHGFALTFRQECVAEGICVTGVLSHRDGHSERTSITLPHDTSGSKNAVQAIGSSVSYGKRYTAGMLLNLTSTNDPTDDGGQASGFAELPPEVQDAVDRLRAAAMNGTEAFRAQWKTTPHDLRAAVPTHEMDALKAACAAADNPEGK